jgi:hypothetical protein
MGLKHAEQNDKRRKRYASLKPFIDERLQECAFFAREAQLLCAPSSTTFHGKKNQDNGQHAAHEANYAERGIVGFGLFFVILHVFVSP